MAAVVRLRDDFDAATLRGLARGSRDPAQLRRLLSLAEIYDGGSRGDAARIGGVGLQTVRDWVFRFNGSGPGTLIDPKPPGKAPELNDAQRQALVQVVKRGPISAPHVVVCWRLVDLAQWVWDEFRIRISVASARTESHRACARRVAGSANPTSSAGHAPAGTEVDYELTFDLDHSAGADQTGGKTAALTSPPGTRPLLSSMW